MFWLRNKKNNFLLHTLIWGPGTIFYPVNLQHSSCKKKIKDQMASPEASLSGSSVFSNSDKDKGKASITSRSGQLLTLLTWSMH